MVAMGLHMSKYMNRVPSFKFVLGALHTEAGETVERRRVVRNR
jgi:hypothetical protein